MGIILNTLKEILKLKSKTTIPEIASYAEKKKIDVLKVINQNKRYLIINPKDGSISGINLEKPLRDKLWETGKYYKIESYGMFSHEGYKIEIKDDSAFKELIENKIIGTFQDHRNINVIENTEKNIQIIESHGYKPWSEIIIDDQLWEE